MAERRTRRTGRLALLLGLIGSHMAITSIANTPSVGAADPIPDAGLPEVLVDAEAVVSERTEPLAAGVTGVSKVNDGFPQMDTEVLAIAEHDGIMYIGGKFTQVEIAATGELFDQPFLAAFERETGEWISSFTPAINGNVWDLKVTDDGQLIVAGQFRNVDGAPNTAGLAMIDLATGEVNPNWSVNLVVTGTTRWALGRALDIDGDLLYIAGNFTRITGTNGITTSVGQMARVNLSTGNVDTSFRPNFDGIVFDVDAIGDKVYVVGNYFYTNGEWTLGQSTLGTDGQLFPGQGAPVRVAANVNRNYQQAILSLGDEVWMTGSEHNTHVYTGSSYDFLRGFISMPFGDGQALAELNGVIYKGTHANPNTYEYADTIVYPQVTGWTSRKPVKWVGAWDAELGGSHDHLDWYPQVGTKTGEGGWELFADSVDCLWAGGDFDRGSFDGDVPRYVGGFARFCTTDDVAPGVPTDLTATPTNNGVNLAWTGTEDDRLGEVRYELLKNDSVFATFVGTTTFRDADGVAGDRYFVRSMDYTGNRSATTPVTVASPDTEAPSTPTDLVGAADIDGNVTLTWTASTDNLGVAEYVVFSNGTEVGRVNESPAIIDNQGPGTREYQVQARDAAGNASELSDGVDVAGVGDDDVRPGFATDLLGVIEANGDVTLTWTAATDNVGVVEYIVTRNAVEIDRVTDTTAVIPAPAPGSHWYQIRAVDAAGNEGGSTPSFRVDIPTPPEDDTTRPGFATDLNGVIEDDGDVTLTWTAATDNVGVVEYIVTRNAVEIDRVTDTTAVIPAPAVGAHFYQIRAVDAAGNEGGSTPSFRVDIEEAPGNDTTSPNTPQDLVGVIEDNGDVTLTWTASTDNVGVTGYIVFRNGIEIDRVTDTTAVIPTPATGPHWYQVRAFDAAGNESFKTPSTRIDIPTAPEDDTTSPNTPQDLVGVIEDNGDVTLTWTASTDNVGVTGYIVFRNGIEIDRVTDTTAVIPTPATGPHWYQVRAFDAAGNESFKTPSTRIDI